MSDIPDSLKSKCAEYFRVERFIEGFRALSIDDEQEQFEPILYSVDKEYKIEKIELSEAISNDNGEPDRSLIPKYFGFLFATGLADYLLFITKGLLFEESKGMIRKGVNGREYLLGLLVDCEGIKYDMFTPKDYCEELVHRFEHDIFLLSESGSVLDPPTMAVGEIDLEGSLWCHDSGKDTIQLSDFDIASATLKVAEDLAPSKSWN